MASQIEIEEFVQRQVKDSGKFSDILSAMNRANLVIAASEKPLILLPALVMDSDVVTDITYDYISLPTDYLRHLYKVYSADIDGDITIYPNRQVMESVLGSSSGTSLNGVCVEGRNLLYNGIPSVADTLTLYYYIAPNDFVDGENETPDWLPSDLHYQLIGNWAAADILIEMSTDWDFSEEKRALCGQRAQNLLSEFQVGMIELYRRTHDNRPSQNFARPTYIQFF